MKQLLLFIIMQSYSLLAQSDTIFYENEYYEITDSIEVLNKSFEEVSSNGININNRSVPRFWLNCGLFEFPHESPVTIHIKGEDTKFNVQHDPVHGNVFISMVTRENESFERISQQLNYTLEEDTLYTLGFYVANSLSMESSVRPDPDVIKRFDNPVRLVIWCGDGYCSESDELYVSEDLLDEEWKYVQAIFKPNSDCDKISIEAYFPSGYGYTNGNLLLDGLTDIYVLNRLKSDH